MLEKKEEMRSSSMLPEPESAEELEMAVPEQPLKSIYYYSRYFLTMNPEDRKTKLDDALRFITGELKSIEEKMRNAEVDVMKVYDELYERLP